MATSTATLEGPETRDNAERAVQRMRESLAKAEHVREEVIDCIKREPAMAVGAAFVGGIAIGALLGWIWRRPATTR